MKKPIKTIEKQLVLVRNRVRTLTHTDLDKVAGGNTVPFPTSCRFSLEN